MTRLQAVGVMLVALGLVYALLYAAWLRKRRRNASAAIAVERHRSQDGAAPAPALREDRTHALVVEGTYVSTTTAESRLERVAVAGLGNRSRATLTVDRGNPDELVRIDRQGESTVVVPRSRLLGVRRDRGMAGKFLGANRLVVLQWRADDGAVYETGFHPRYRADVDRVESALWWHSGGSESKGDEPAGDGPAPPDEAVAGRTETHTDTDTDQGQEPTAPEGGTTR